MDHNDIWVDANCNHCGIYAQDGIIVHIHGRRPLYGDSALNIWRCTGDEKYVFW